MWNHQFLRKIDFRTLPIIIALMGISLLVISSTTQELVDFGEETFWTPLAKSQLRWFAIGSIVYIFFAGFDYHKLRSWTWVLYFVTLGSLFGLFFTTPIQNVHRWYRLPFIGGTLQPSEYAKLIVVLALSWYLEKKEKGAGQKRSVIVATLIVLVPFLLILKQPDLGTALVLYPIALVMFYFGGIQKKVVFCMTVGAMAALLFVLLMFLGYISHEEMRPIATKFLKEYQYERLSPDTYHQKAAQMALALGGVWGSGWHKSEFTARQWLPFGYTDSVFPAFGEEFGLVGIFFLIIFFFGLIYFSFQVTAVAKDRFGRLLSAGITVYLGVHVIVNMGMMCGFLPITGVPLILVSYGGSSVLATMTALGILQSIYSRRFMF
ncbi:MAG: FtsW/RodA/SpoVE family cell cycle protein [Chlamydiota bacterium]